MQCQYGVKVLIGFDLANIINIYLVSIIDRNDHTANVIHSAKLFVEHLHIKSESIKNGMYKAYNSGSITHH